MCQSNAAATEPPQTTDTEHITDCCPTLAPGNLAIWQSWLAAPAGWVGCRWSDLGNVGPPRLSALHSPSILRLPIWLSTSVPESRRHVTTHDFTRRHDSPVFKFPQDALILITQNSQNTVLVGTTSPSGALRGGTKETKKKKKKVLPSLCDGCQVSCIGNPPSDQCAVVCSLGVGFQMYK